MAPRSSRRRLRIGYCARRWGEYRSASSAGTCPTSATTLLRWPSRSAAATWTSPAATWAERTRATTPTTLCWTTATKATRRRRRRRRRAPHRHRRITAAREAVCRAGCEGGREARSRAVWSAGAEGRVCGPRHCPRSMRALRLCELDDRSRRVVAHYRPPLVLCVYYVCTTTSEHQKMPLFDVKMLTFEFSFSTTHFQHFRLGVDLDLFSGDKQVASMASKGAFGLAASL
eukprot:7378677-Prymnesium_polylepis.2